MQIPANPFKAAPEAGRQQIGLWSSLSSLVRGTERPAARFKASAAAENGGCNGMTDTTCPGPCPARPDAGCLAWTCIVGFALLVLPTCACGQLRLRPGGFVTPGVQAMPHLLDGVAPDVRSRINAALAAADARVRVAV